MFFLQISAQKEWQNLKQKSISNLHHVFKQERKLK